MITDQNGNEISRMAFDPFGKRLTEHVGSSVLSQDAANDSSYHGYTGHSQLDHLGLVHMGGRVYDPDSGRFLSADLFVQSPYNTQSYNRYSYVFNNPLRNTDPSGYLSREDEAKKAPEEVLVLGHRISQQSNSLNMSLGFMSLFSSANSSFGGLPSGMISGFGVASKMDRYIGKLGVRARNGDIGAMQALQNIRKKQKALQKKLRTGGLNGEGLSLGAQEGDPDNGGFSPVSGLYGTDGGAVVDLTVGESGMLMDAGGTAYTLGGNGVVSALASGEATSICPSCYAVGAGGLLRGAFTSAKGFLVGGITVRTPLAISVQRFGVMSTVSADYWGLRIGASVFANRTFAAIKPAWNPLTTYTTGVIPRGTQVTFGLIGPQGVRYPGGSLQFIVNSRNVTSQSTQLVR